MIHPELLEILCCPETRQPVREAPAALVESLNRALRDGSLEPPPGGASGDPLDGGLLREDGQFLYPVRKGIPIMLVEERIPIPAPPGDRETPPAGDSGEDVEEDRDPGHPPVETGAGS